MTELSPLTRIFAIIALITGGIVALVGASALIAVITELGMIAFMAGLSVVFVILSLVYYILEI
jgi:hypothetical protein